MDITYYALFQYDDDGICIHFPAVPQAITCADSFDEGVYMASDVLGLVLHKSNVSDLPAERIDQIHPEENQRLVPITVQLEDRNGILFCDGVIEFE